MDCCARYSRAAIVRGVRSLLSVAGLWWGVVVSRFVPPIVAGGEVGGRAVGDGGEVAGCEFVEVTFVASDGVDVDD